MKLPGFLLADRNQARAPFSKSGFVAVRSASARVMTADHKLWSLSVIITARNIARHTGKEEEQPLGGKYPLLPEADLLSLLVKNIGQDNITGYRNCLRCLSWDF